MVKKLLILFLLASGFAACSQLALLRKLKKGETVQKNFTAKVPFEMRHDLIIIKAKLNNETSTRDFIFDTGAPNVITPELITALNIQSEKGMNASDANGKKQALNQVTLDKVQIGDVVFEKSIAFVSDFGNVPEIKCMQSDGILGANVMRHANWLIDYDKKELTFTDGKLPAVAGTPSVVAFDTKAQGTPNIKLQVNGKETGVIFDTGKNSAFISINKKAFAELTAGSNVPVVRGFGAMGAGAFGAVADTVNVCKAAGFRIGDSYQRSEVVLMSTKGSSLFGNGFMMTYFTHVGIDWTNEKIYLWPRTDDRAAPALFESYGCSFSLREGKLVVVAVFENSPAAAAKLNNGDEVLAVNGKETNQLTVDAFCTVLSEIRNGKTIVLRIAGASPEKEITIQKTDLLKK